MRKFYQSPSISVDITSFQDVIMASIHGDDNVGRITDVDWTVGGDTL